MVKTDATGHKWMFSQSLQKWVKVYCSCDITASACPHHMTLERGALKKCKRTRPTEENYQAFERNMQVLTVISWL